MSTADAIPPTPPPGPPLSNPRRSATGRSSSSISSNPAPAPPRSKPAKQPDEIHEHLDRTHHDTIFETQTIAPAPGTTYYQLAVLTGDRIVLRDWPRQRMSQKWTRDGALNPGQTAFTYEDFLAGEMKEKLVWIFGEHTYQIALEKAKAARYRA
ncbi:hypothetical protein HK102_002560 [Quaeritorhiza haematococci]|nr:hypothetical protein HK102_002560 [Quaeritorhiza haematococci]